MIVGGTVQCEYCQAVNQFSARDEANDETAAVAVPTLNEAERFQKLWRQRDTPLTPPPSVQHFFAGGGLAPHQFNAATQEWLRARQQLRNGGSFAAAERMYFLTLCHVPSWCTLGLNM